MPIDPSIPLQAGQNIPQFGPDLKQIITLQNLAQQMQARKLVMDQQQQGQNALRQVFGNKDNIDQSTGLPKPQALAPVIQANPEMGQNLLKTLSTTQHNQALTQAQQGKLHQDFLRSGYDTMQSMVSAYDSNLKTVGPDRAGEIAKDEYNRSVDDLASSGIYPPKWIEAIRNKAPPVEEARARANNYVMSQPKIQEKIVGAQLKANEPPTPYQQQKLSIEQQRADEQQRHDLGIEQGKKTEKGGLKDAKEVTVFDDKGNPVESVAVVDDSDPNNPSKLKHFGTGAPVVIPPGGHVGVGKSTVALLGSRESVLLQRQLGSGVQASKALKDIVALPDDATRGFFGGRKQGPGLFDASKETLTNRLTSQDVQAYNAITPGVTRSLALIDSQGLAPGAAFTDSFNAEMLKEGDTQLTKMLKLARQREIVEAGMETLLSNDRVGKDQKAKAKEVVDGIKEAVPWTPLDVISLMKAPKGTTLRQVADQKGLGAGKRIPAPEDPEEANRAWNSAAPGTVFVDKNGNEHVVPGGR